MLAYLIATQAVVHSLINTAQITESPASMQHFSVLAFSNQLRDDVMTAIARMKLRSFGC